MSGWFRGSLLRRRRQGVSVQPLHSAGDPVLRPTQRLPKRLQTWMDGQYLQEQNFVLRPESVSVRGPLPQRRVRRQLRVNFNSSWETRTVGKRDQASKSNKRANPTTSAGDMVEMIKQDRRQTLSPPRLAIARLPGQHSKSKSQNVEKVPEGLRLPSFRPKFTKPAARRKSKGVVACWATPGLTGSSIKWRRSLIVVETRSSLVDTRTYGHAKRCFQFAAPSPLHNFGPCSNGPYSNALKRQDVKRHPWW